MVALDRPELANLFGQHALNVRFLRIGKPLVIRSARNTSTTRAYAWMKKIPMAFDVWTENPNLFFHLNHQLFIVG